MFKNSFNKIIQKSNQLAVVVSALAILVMPFLATTTTQAAQITSRKVTLGSSTPSAVTSYTVSTAALPTATAVQSVELIACTTASGACTTPSGFTITGSATTGVTTGLGTNTGWTNNTATPGSLRITNTNAVAPSGVVSIPWTSVTNPSATNTTFFLRMNTYSGTAWTGLLDSGVIAVSTSAAITVTASVDETLTFCTGTSGITSSSCAGATGSSVALGTLTSATTGSGTSQIGITTNAGTGYAVTYFGPTLTSGANTITAIGATAAASVQNTSQFGVNLRANTVPTIGSDPAGAGSGTPTTQYNIVNSYAFVASTATSIASAGAADAFRLYTVSYIANIPALQAPGAYTTTLTYVGTATF